MNLYDSLLRYAAGKYYPMHMPGHKRAGDFVMENPYAFDVTEIEGTDNLHHPRGIILQEMNRMKEKYETKNTYLLVNGSTCGILAAISACCRQGDTIAVARNCHRSVYHAMELRNLHPVYLYPDVDEENGIGLSISPEQVKDVVQKYQPSCVVITSPTYEGVVSDIRRIAEATHEKDIPLVVDEAHGAHLAWSDRLPESAMRQGADLVVESLHKTLPALTQTGLLHLMTDRISPEKLEHYLDIYETSSPSYVLMGSISQCMQWLFKNSESRFPSYLRCLDKFRKQAAGWRCLRLWEIPEKEPSKLVICTVNTLLSGMELASLLREKYSIEVEMTAPDYVIAMTSVGDVPERIQRFADALNSIDAELSERVGEKKAGKKQGKRCRAEERAVIRQTISEAVGADWETVPLSKSIGRVSAEYAMVYPPGIPFLVPGEEVTEGTLLSIMSQVKQGLVLLGLQDETGNTLRVCRQEE